MDQLGSERAGSEIRQPAARHFSGRPGQPAHNSIPQFCDFLASSCSRAPQQNSMKENLEHARTWPASGGQIEPVHDRLAGSLTSTSFAHDLNKQRTISSRRGLDLNLTDFAELIGSPSTLMYENSEPRNGSVGLLLHGVSTQQVIRSSSLGPPTPPHEIKSCLWVTNQVLRKSASETEVGGETSSSSIGFTTLSPQYQSYPAQEVVNEIEPLNFSSPGSLANLWLNQALKVATEASVLSNLSPSTKIISQVLPANASDQRSVKTYEIACEYLQQNLPEPSYVSITHALTVSPGQVVEDFPKSPPVTPSFNGDEGYFGDQTVFTHAAQVPVHHEMRSIAFNPSSPPQRHIMMSEANLIILERYIPPTSCQETLDLFDPSSCRSYLADRLPELAIGTGSLLLIYPTKKGAQTFARRYVAPVLDPLLREMAILKGLNTNAAERLGVIQGIDALCEFDGMKANLESFCNSMNSRTNTRKSRSMFALSSSKTGKVVLDRNTWMTWFVEQEHQRMKQDLIEYHQAGGKLPEVESDNSEITAGMLTREVTESLRKSTAAAGGVDIEVGVFIIRRVQRTA